MKSFATVLLATSAICGSAYGANLTIPTGGLVSVELVFSEADFSNTMSIISPAVGVAAAGCQLEPANGLGGLHLLSERQSQRGCRVDLDANPATSAIDPFAAGTTFEFGMCAQTDLDPDCEFVWSSDPASNPDSFDHLITTELEPTAFPGQIFELAWEDLSGGGDMDFNDLIAVLRIGVDSDGDALWDDWEAFGIDTDADGTVDLDLPALGADPMRKDLFLEIDYMDCAVAGGDCAAGDTHSHQPIPAAVTAVIQAFANAPVPNPDGSTGITLHVDVSNAIPHQDALNIPGLCFAGGPGIGDFDAVKADPANFGTNNPRRFAYRYGLFTHQQLSGNTTSGCGELPGNDFQVSLAGWTLPAAQLEAGTLMHEFGHNLNLLHGGDQLRTNRKPNYISVMRYGFQTLGIPPTDPDGAGPLTTRVDYSSEALDDLDENNLSEPVGVGDGSDNTRYFCPAGRSIGPGMGAIDWNCDGDTVDTGIAVDINEDGGFKVLTGFDDWANLGFAFQSTGDFDDGEHSFSERVVEIELADALQDPREIRIDVKPDSIVNTINPGSQGRVPVLILSADGFDAPTEVLQSTLTFGRTGNEPSLAKCRATDFDLDGVDDLLCHFHMQAADFQPGTTQATLKGETVDGDKLFGSDHVRTVPACGIGFELTLLLPPLMWLRGHRRRSIH